MLLARLVVTFQCRHDHGARITENVGDKLIDMIIVLSLNATPDTSNTQNHRWLLEFGQETEEEAQSLPFYGI